MYDPETELPPLHCERCGAEHAPSCYAPYLESTPSGADLFGQFSCHECNATYSVAFHATSFMQWYQQERVAEIANARKSVDLLEQRRRSDMGRQVADFRRQLDAVETVEEIGWT
jgi:hypothetical protein